MKPHCSYIYNTTVADLLFVQNILCTSQGKVCVPFISAHNDITDVYYSEGEISERLLNPFKAAVKVE